MSGYTGVASYAPRVVDDELDALLPALPAIALEGAKAVGKTRTAVQRANTVHSLDQAGAIDVARADPVRLVGGETPVLIDEWQRVPESWDLVRRAIDDDPSPGRYLLTGSASPADAGMHSGAGRIVRLRMRPMTLAERGAEQPSVSLAELLSGSRPPISGVTRVRLDDYAHQICQSGFPALRGLPQRALNAVLDGYIDNIIDRDFPDMGLTPRNPGALRRWLTAHAAATATNASFEAIRDASTAGEHDKPSRATTQPYRDILERLWVLDPLPAWLPTRNHLKRLGSSPKHHLADPALAARLLGADASALVEARPLGPTLARDTTLIGQLFESLVTLCVRVFAQAAGARVGHLRTHSGDREIDLIAERGDHRVVAIEVKLRSAPSDDDARHLLWLRERLGDDLLDAVMVTTGREAYRRRDGVAVVPAALLGP